MKYKVFIPILVNIILTTILGLSFHLEIDRIALVLLHSCMFEIVIFLLINKGFTTKLSNAQIIKRFKHFLRLTAWFQALMIAYLAIRLYLGFPESWLIVFYGHLVIVFYSLAAVLCISHIKIKNEEQL